MGQGWWAGPAAGVTAELLAVEVLESRDGWCCKGGEKACSGGGNPRWGQRPAAEGDAGERRWRVEREGRRMALGGDGGGGGSQCTGKPSHREGERGL